MIQAPASAAKLTAAIAKAAFPMVSSGQRDRVFVALYNISHNRKARDDDGHRGQRHRLQAPLKKAADRLAIIADQSRNKEETYAARDDREEHEQPKIITGEPAGDGDELIRDRHQALEQDDPGAPGGIGLAELLDPVAITIE